MTMNLVIANLAGGILLLYLAATFSSALRMYFVHSRYVHVEFGGKKWQRFGRWAPRQYRRLRYLRIAAAVAIVALLLSVLIETLTP